MTVDTVICRERDTRGMHDNECLTIEDSYVEKTEVTLIIFVILTFDTEVTAMVVQLYVAYTNRMQSVDGFAVTIMYVCCSNPFLIL